MQITSQQSFSYNCIIAHFSVNADGPVEDDILSRGASASPPTTITGLGPNQVVLNAGGDQYQTVTIVPNDSSSGEVSYVLIVQQNEDKKVIPDQQSEVYEFEGEDSGTLLLV